MLIVAFRFRTVFGLACTGNEALDKLRVDVLEQVIPKKWDDMLSQLGTDGDLR